MKFIGLIVVMLGGMFSVGISDGPIHDMFSDDFGRHMWNDEYDTDLWNEDYGHHMWEDESFEELNQYKIELIESYDWDSLTEDEIIEAKKEVYLLIELKAEELEIDLYPRHMFKYSDDYDKYDEDKTGFKKSYGHCR